MSVLGLAAGSQSANALLDLIAMVADWDRRELDVLAEEAIDAGHVEAFDLSLADAVRGAMQHLALDINRHKDLYYNGEPVISDAEYDALEETLRPLEAAFPEWVTYDSPLAKVGAPVSTLFAPVRHDHPMLSLSKAKSPEDPELDNFLARFDGRRLAAMPKFDGVSLSLTYKGGQLELAATRGDGAVGEDVTQNILGSKVRNLPTTLDLPVDREVRGEVVMRKSDFAAYNAKVTAEAAAYEAAPETERKSLKRPGRLLVNTRNGAAGTLRAKDRQKVEDRLISFYPFDLIGGDERPINEQLVELGFEVEGYVEVASADEVRAYIDDAVAGRDEQDYDIDGVVVRLADRREYEGAGVTGHHPKGALAVKLTPELGETRLRSVTWQVGKSGVVAPVAEIDPVFVAGTTINRATLHNAQMIADKDIRIGDRIQIRRAGDVIPHVDGVAPGYVRDGAESPIDIPTHCPSCAAPLVETGSSRILQCQNSEGCSAQQSRRLIHWASRASADIDAVGQSWIDKLSEAGLLEKPSDFYRLDKETLLERFSDAGMGKRLAEKMEQSIEASKNVGLRKTMIGFAIPLASEGTAKRLCRAGYKSIEEVAAASVEDLVKIEDIGPAVAESLVAYFAQPSVQQELKDLRSLGVNLDVLPEDAPVEVKVEDGDEAPPFYGKAVCITGKLTIDRSVMQKIVEREGARAASGVSAKTDYLIAGPDIFEKGSSKLKSAEKLGIPVLTEDQARDLLRLSPRDAVA